MNKAIFYEFFLKYFADLEEEQEKLKEQLRKGRSVHVIAMQLYDLEIRMNEVDRLFQSMKPWFF